MLFAHLLLLLAEQRAFKAQHFGNVQVVFAQRVQTLCQVVNEHQNKSPDELQSADEALKNVFCENRTIKSKFNINMTVQYTGLKLHTVWNIKSDCQGNEII